MCVFLCFLRSHKPLQLRLPERSKQFPKVTSIANPSALYRGSKTSGKSKGGLSKGGLGPKGANWAKKGPFGAISALPPWLWGVEELVLIGPEKAPIGAEKVPICPEKARLRRKDFPPIFSENLGLKPPFVSPPLDFPKNPQIRKRGFRSQESPISPHPRKGRFESENPIFHVVPCREMGMF